MSYLVRKACGVYISVGPLKITYNFYRYKMQLQLKSITYIYVLNGKLHILLETISLRSY